MRPRAAVIETLRRRRIAPTAQRVEIAQVLFARPQHLSADQVLAQVNSDRPRVSKATVYNTLGLFAKCGLIREIIADPARLFYDTNTSEHHHVYNVDTGTLTDIEAEAVTIRTLPNLPDGTVADGVEVIIRVRSQGT
jgi:Fur family iron response transcriptional regulator